MLTNIAAQRSPRNHIRSSHVLREISHLSGISMTIQSHLLDALVLLHQHWLPVLRLLELVPVSIIYHVLYGGEKWKLTMTVDSAPAQIHFLAMGIINVVSDLFIFVLPLQCLLKLYVSWQKKIGLCLMFVVFVTTIMYVLLMALDQSTC
jgi:hypothetical protein